MGLPCEMAQPTVMFHMYTVHSKVKEMHNVYTCMHTFLKKSGIWLNSPQVTNQLQFCNIDVSGDKLVFSYVVCSL